MVPLHYHNNFMKNCQPTSQLQEMRVRDYKEPHTAKRWQRGVEAQTGSPVLLGPLASSTWVCAGQGTPGSR